MSDCLTIALMFVCNGAGIYITHKLFTWFENQPAKYDSKKTYLQNVRKAK